MPDSRRQDEDVLAYFEAQATKKMAYDRLTNTSLFTFFKFRIGLNDGS